MAISDEDLIECWFGRSNELEIVKELGLHSTKGASTALAAAERIGEAAADLADRNRRKVRTVACLG
jgi:hypothetical protein